MNQDPAHANGDGWESPGDAALTPPEPKGLFTPLRCCGCLAIVGVFAIVGIAFAAKLFLDQTFPRAPIEVPKIESTPEERSEVQDRVDSALDANGEIRLTPRDLTLLVDSFVGETPMFIEDTARFHCDATEDGYLRMRFTGQFIEDAQFIGGRFLNVEFTGNLTIEDGEVTSAEVASFAIGGHGQDTPATSQDSKKFFDEMIKNQGVPPEWRAQIDDIESFQFDGEAIRLRLKNTGRGRTQETPAEVAPETGTTPDAGSTPTPDTPTEESGAGSTGGG